MTNGQSYIKLFRKMKKWGWYKDSNTKAVFIHLLLSATWEETEYLGERLLPGDVIFGRKAYARDTGLTEQNVRTAISHLLKTGEISTIKVTNKFTVLHIERWRFFQGESGKVTNKLTNDQPTTNHIQESKESKEYNNLIGEHELARDQDPFAWEVETIVEYLNEKTGKHFKAGTRSTVKIISARIREGYTVNEFMEVIDKKTKEWINDPTLDQWLNPRTLFRVENFERFLNAGKRKPKKEAAPKEWIVYKDENGNEFAKEKEKEKEAE